MNKILFPIVILAGGLATRLRPITETIPKALIDIDGEPFVAHQLRLLAARGVQDVVMCLSYLGEQVVDFVGNGKQFGLNVQYVFDGDKLLGTAGAIKNAFPVLPDTFFVLYGDSYLPCDYYVVQQAFLQSDSLGLMTVFYNEGKWDTSNIEFANKKILTYDKLQRTPRMQHIDYGLGILTKKSFDSIPANEFADLVTIYQDLLKQQQLAAYEVSERFYENGSRQGIVELGQYLNLKKTSAAIY